jgi:leader peptidase (prepilin peptidase)/N-methyltransferase
VFGEPLLLVYAAVLGLVVGSFVNVLVHRVPRQIPFALERSRCTWCKAPVRARDNIPVVSFVLLRGRCRQCGAPISPRYPLVEIGTAALFVLCAARFGADAAAAVAAVLCTLLLALALIDAEHFLLPDVLTLPGLLIGLVLQPFFPTVEFIDALVGALVGAGILILLINVWFWLRQEEGMGLGDVNMLAMIGAFLGWQGVLVTLVSASFIGAVVGIVLVLARRLGFKSRLPFGAFLALGGLIALFWGPPLIALYLRLP